MQARTLRWQQASYGWLGVMLLITAGCSWVIAPPAASPPPVEIATESLVGYPVVSQDGTAIGSVDGIILDTVQGVADYVIIRIDDPYAFGKGSGGPQDHYLVVPWDRLQRDPSAPRLVLDVVASVVTAAPIRHDVPDTTSAAWDADIQAFWAAQPTGDAQ